MVPSSLLPLLSLLLSPLPATPLSTKPQIATEKWQPKIDSLEECRKLRGQEHSSERIGSIGFHHVEFYCGDAKSTAHRFSLALGMDITCMSGQNTGNDQCVTYGLESGDVRFLFTAPYSEAVATGEVMPMNQGSGEPPVAFDAPNPLPSFSIDNAHSFFRKHGLAAKALGIEVKDASKAFEAAVSNGAKPILDPVTIPACLALSRKYAEMEEEKHKSKGEESVAEATPEEETSLKCELAEVELYGDVNLRFVSFSDKHRKDEQIKRLPFLPHLAPQEPKKKKDYGIRRIDHAVGNVPNLQAYYKQISTFTGFHEFAEFTSEDVGTVESGLNSVVLASDTEHVLIPLNEPTQGRRKSQIQTFLEQNEGPGLQHLALKTDDIFKTISKMRLAEEEFGGFELMKRPSDEYYQELPDRLGDQLTPEQYAKLEELGILADADEEGILLQVFTKPIGDRPTFFIEIIQRIGCLYNPDGSDSEMLQRPGCGGFGQGNFRELFKAIEDHEKTLKV